MEVLLCRRGEFEAAESEHLQCQSSATTTDELLFGRLPHTSDGLVQRLDAALVSSQQLARLPGAPTVQKRKATRRKEPSTGVKAAVEKPSAAVAVSEPTVVQRRKMMQSHHLSRSSSSAASPHATFHCEQLDGECDERTEGELPSKQLWSQRRIEKRACQLTPEMALAKLKLEERDILEGVR